ncbi:MULTISPECIES: 50S ribosomal protein L18 [Halobacterium]|uniref:Large ribosomal subunit protein uL18 n=5 Tax=Halobacterium salinarum TaxID=2242 RepID=RL18_HALSA|nr:MULTISPECIES: 50S ribosomal protein L18 [Halobacterium]B0R675.1 RecName: Full=Large ribosomal subunit protein uL18; AltName: Full=50S ribosomal protein L18 [Halobacterium salinarum R1]P50562.3 RecName: Full=Large ribosomal subunit protein uL18; AltName: Full=50S ribosomal protein L18; AltName: Full=HCuL18; AltName: Full=HHal18; AltName: Full=HL13; AltName: Full=HSal18 [Halobacterium salinarum NRC-1]AAG19955.1 50S ribosomal protein L18P [Halobacterium salinarum NRC-1]MBB6088961.1 large subuni
MATGPRYKVPMRRRREVRTDYHQRLRLLKSGKPRLVARKSNKHVTAQLVTTGPDGDETVASAHSSDLDAYGWAAPTGNLPAAYLTGLLAGQRAVDAGVEEAVLDIGLNTATPGSKVFAIQEGAIDAGLDVPHNDSVLADWSRTRGEHIAEYAESLDEPLYSGDFDATALPAHFDETREAIMED